MADTKKNYKQKRSGTLDAELKYGHIHYDETKSALMIRSGSDGRHNIIMDADGNDRFRKGSTQVNCPGTFSVVAADDVAENLPGIMFVSESGDVVINAPNGRVRINARNIDIRASGAGTENGVIVLDAKEKVIVKAQTINVDAKSSLKLFSDRTVDVIGNTILNLYGGFIESADGATILKGSKPFFPPNFWEIRNALRKVQEIIG